MRVGEPNVRLSLRYLPFQHRGEEPAARDPARPPGAFNHVHISENDRGVPGTGPIDFASVFKALKASGYDGWMTVRILRLGAARSRRRDAVWRPLFEPAGGCLSRRHQADEGRLGGERRGAEEPPPRTLPASRGEGFLPHLCGAEGEGSAVAARQTSTDPAIRRPPQEADKTHSSRAAVRPSPGRGRKRPPVAGDVGRGRPLRAEASGSPRDEAPPVFVLRWRKPSEEIAHVRHPEPPKELPSSPGPRAALGAAIARGSGAAGWSIAVNYAHDDAGAAAVVAAIEAAGGRRRPSSSTSPTRRASAMASPRSATGSDRWRSIVNNATGPQPMKPLEEQSWDDHLDQLRFFVQAPL